ncbi:hypothetical protein RYX36_004642 [Vicia faba]
MDFPEESLARTGEGNSELNHQVDLPIVYACNKGRGALALYGNTTSSDLKFMLSETEMYLDSLSSTSSTRSDAGSAPTDPVEILDRISTESSKWVDLSGRQLPPEWSLDFSAMIFPVVHIGAIAVSFLFVVMMFHIQIAEIHEEVLRYLPELNTADQYPLLHPLKDLLPVLIDGDRHEGQSFRLSEFPSTMPEMFSDALRSRV